jgi:hypothetical protein
MKPWLPYNTSHQTLRTRISSIGSFGTLHNFNAYCQQSTMLRDDKVHKDDSHKKKKKKTRRKDTDEKHVEKRHCLTRSPVSVATPPVVSQTQEEHLQHAPTNAGAIASIANPMDDMPGYPLANNIARAALANDTHPHTYP